MQLQQVCASTHITRESEQALASLCLHYTLLKLKNTAAGGTVAIIRVPSVYSDRRNNPKQNPSYSDPQGSPKESVTSGVGTGSLHIGNSSGALRMGGVTRFATISTATLPLRGDRRVVWQHLSLLALAATARVPAGTQHATSTRKNGVTQHAIFYSQCL